MLLPVLRVTSDSPDPHKELAALCAQLGAWEREGREWLKKYQLFPPWGRTDGNSTHSISQDMEVVAAAM